MSGRNAAREFITARGWTRVGEVEWAELRQAFPKITPAQLLKAGIAVDQPVRGVEQHGFDELETSLIELAGIYALRPDLRRSIRQQVIAAKDRARWASRNSRVEETVRRRKAEMLEWMLIWLDDPAMFETWVRLRRYAMESAVQPECHAREDDLHRGTDIESQNERDPRDGEETPES